VVTLDEAVGAGDAGAVEAGADGGAVVEVGGGVDVELAFQGAVTLGHLQEVVVERRPRGGGDEPVGAGDRLVAAGQFGEVAKEWRGFSGAVGVAGGEAVPHPGVPAVVS